MHRHQKLTKSKDPISKKEYYKQINYPNIPNTIRDMYIRTKIGDRLDILANKYYNDSQLWWVISIANPDIVRRDSIILNPGIEIRVPADLESILDNFESLNE